MCLCVSIVMYTHTSIRDTVLTRKGSAGYGIDMYKLTF